MTGMIIRKIGGGSHKAVAIAALALLVGCESLPPQFQRASKATDPVGKPATGGQLVLEEQNVEAPEVFQMRDMALWDGRPSFGGVWVALTGDIQPERVLITNTKTGKSVVGALFKREEQNPGPPIRLSSDAAASLAAIPGEPVLVEVTALRKEAVAKTAPVPVDEVPQDVATTTLDPAEVDGVEVAALAPVEAAADVTETVVDAPAPDLTESIATAIETAVDPVETAAPEAEVQTASLEETTPAPAPQSSLNKPFLQIATLSSRENADRLFLRMAESGLGATVKALENSSGKTVYRVLVGPASDADAMKSLSTKVAGLGISDAFQVAE